MVYYLLRQYTNKNTTLLLLWQWQLYDGGYNSFTHQTAGPNQRSTSSCESSLAQWGEHLLVSNIVSLVTHLQQSSKSTWTLHMMKYLCTLKLDCHCPSRNWHQNGYFGFHVWNCRILSEGTAFLEKNVYSVSLARWLSSKSFRECCVFHHSQKLYHCEVESEISQRGHLLLRFYVLSQRLQLSLHDFVTYGIWHL